MADATSWTDVLKTGISGLIDSQIAKNYAASDPAYNTAGGKGGQAQKTPAGAGVTLSPLVIGAALLAAVVVVVLIARR